jgi:hypothetical protein
MEKKYLKGRGVGGKNKKLKRMKELQEREMH